MAEFPPLAPVPSPAVRRTIPSNDWEACLDAWMALLGIRLNASDQQFKVAAPEDASIPPFLGSYYQYTAAGDSSLQSGPKARQLRKLCFLATRRYILDLSNPPDGIMDWKLLGNLSCCYPSSATLKTSLSSAWDLHGDKITSSIERAKAVVIKNISSANSSSNPEVISDIRRLTILASVLPACGQELIAGSDFLDAIAEAYQSKGYREEFRKILVANIYVGLVSLLKEPVNLSSLLDQLFSLKATARVGAPKMKKEPTLLSDLICSSDILLRLDKYLSIHPQKRGQDLLASLRTYQMESKSLHHRYQRRKKLDKGKEVSSDPIVSGELHAHKMSLVTQVQDLFPDLGSAFVVRLLDFYNDNPETIVAHLLDDSLPLELQSLDRSEQLPAPAEPHHSHLPLQPTPPVMPSPKFAPLPVRKNIFDEDVDIAELSRSGEAKGKLHFGRAGADQTADTLLSDHSKHAANKAAILSALATFDSDDDERDDTYDTADVGGAIDGAAGGADGEAEAVQRERRAADMETVLFRTYKSNPGLFARDSATRRSQPRASLKRETEMTDEAIEGWAVMLTRDPKRLAKLEDRLAMDAGGLAGAGSLNQPELRPTSYRRPQPREDGDDSDEGESSGHAGSRGGRGGGGRGRGRGSGGRGRGRGGGPPSGGQGQPDTAASRQRKEENKSSQANHNRRQQRAKKMARGGGLPG
ncbi:Ubiquitin system component Cue [Penicillium griseofulvum]|uniref:Ubiquitin system component Cue n=1 Tax=Penicillium patulum TaxID=5078 RepID=A0A135LAH2_PENPA|nr:Ubiquitin system component Cue [Penicillium griseofulvum]KXG45979.1 Ubiquitin system component Cue [Penicillium griseofulvum]